MAGLGDASGSVGGGFDSAARASRDASAGMDRVNRSGRDTGRSMGALGNTLGRVGKGLGDLGDGAGGAAGGVGGLLRNVNELGGAVSRAGGAMGTVTSAMQTTGMVFGYAAAGSGLLTGAVGALGAVGVGALGAVGVAAGAAGGAMAAFAVDAHKDSAKFGATFKQLGGAAHLASQAISEPMAGAIAGLGRSMVSADNQLTPAGVGIVGSLTEGFGNAAGVLNRSSGAIVDAASVAARGFATLTGEAAPGVEAFMGSLPSLTAGAVSGMSQVTSEFGRSGAAIEGAVPAINRASGSLGGLGAQLVKTGAGSAVPFFENLGSMAASATGMTSNLGPAIKPSMQAFTDVANLGMGAIGSLAPEIAGFARTVSANAPALQQGLTGIGRGMLGVGTGAVEGIAAAAPALDRMGTSLSRYGPAAGRAAGQAGGVVADIVGGAVEGIGMAQESGESFKGGVDSFLGTTRDSGGRITGWGRSAAGGPARSTWGYVGGSGPGGIIPPSSGGPATASDGILGMSRGNIPTGAPGGGGAPIPQQLSGLFTGATQTAQQGAAGIPAAMASAMQQSRQVIGGANLGGAMRAPMAAVQGAVQGAGVAPAVGAQMNQATRVVQNSTGAAASAGSKVGAAIGGGMAKGTTSSTTVTDEIIINRITKMKENAMGAMRAKSPSRDFEDIAGYAPQGFDIGLIKGFRQPPPRAISAGIAERGREAMAASSRSFAQQRAQGDADRTMMQSLRISTPAARVAAQAAQMPAEGLKGAAKREAFGEGAGYKGSRMVFDKQVMSWQAKPGVEMATDRAFSNDMVQSPLSAAQQTAMESMQGALDRGRGGSFGMFGERTQQNILRNRVGAFNVAGQISDYESRANQQQRAAPSVPSNYNPLSIGGSGGGGQSYLGRNRIAMVRDAAGLGGQVAAGYGQGLNANRAAAVGPMGQMAAAQKKRYTDDWGIRSPSTVAAGYSADIMAGSAAGLVGNASGPVGAIGAVSDSMQVVAGDRGLQVGYTWSRNVLTGADQVLKKADYQAAGLPRLDSAAAMTALAGTGLLKAGSGASIVKTVGNTPSVVTLGGPSSGGQRSFTIRHELDINGQVHDIATEVFLDNFGRVQDAVAVAAR